MDIGLAMSTHGLLARDERDFFLQKLEPAEMRPVELAVLAERLGYHSVWFSDHVVMGRDLSASHTANFSGTRAYPERPAMLDVVATMGAIASRTATIRMAPSVLIAPYRHPLTVAHQFATVDVLSNGRLIMSAGSGWDPQEFAAVGADFEHRGAVTEECVEIWKHAWTADWLDFRGRFYEIADVSLEPKPVQKPHPPVWIGGNTKAAMRRAANMGDGWLPWLIGRQQIPQCLEYIRQQPGFQKRNRPFDVVMPLATFQVEDYSHRELGKTIMPTTRDQIIEDVGLMKEAGVTGTLINVPRTKSADQFIEWLEWFAAEIFPAARK